MTRPSPDPRDVLSVRGAREHNLRGVDLDLRKQRLVVFTGVSGSGKSSLAFDTLYAEGQRRYVESLSVYARQFLGQMDKPHYEAIHGLSPTLAIEQRTSTANPRSTVGTVTEILDFLRLLFARLGVQHCPGCGEPVGRQTPEQAADAIMAWPERTRFTVLAPLARDRTGGFGGVFDEARREGFVRVRVDGEVCDLASPPSLDAKRRHTVELVIDRLVVKDGMRRRLMDSVETAFRHGGGSALVVRRDTGEERVFSEQAWCARCDRSFPDLTPQLFSFNSPAGMCPECDGLGRRYAVDPDRVVPDPGASLAEGAVRPWASVLDPSTAGSRARRELLDLFARHGVDPDVPWRDLEPAQRDLILHGAGDEDFEGVARTLLRRWRETTSEDARASYREWLAEAVCEACGGSRLREEARHVRVESWTLPELTSLPVEDLRAEMEALELEGARADIGREVIREIRQRLRFLDDVGLGYLALERSAATLSGGESQRIRLASQLGTELTGVLYILDEPSIGLHPRDNRRLLGTLEHLRDVGNTVIVVEHDAEIIRAADRVVDFGPGAGRQGGAVVAQGTPAEVSEAEGSLTGAYLSGRRRLPVPRTRRESSEVLRIVGAREHNLKGVDVTIPLGVLTVVTGVSGAGKSSLVAGILRPALARHLHGSSEPVGAHDGIEGLGEVDKVVDIDQRPIGRTPRSNPATYTKVFDSIRQLFATTHEARMYGFAPRRFSFNVKGGRCEVCRGDGAIRVEMHFLPDVYVTCEACGGKRFNEQTLRVRYKGLTIAGVLDLTVDEALAFFANHRRIRRVLQTLHDVGLGYVTLGQPSNTLSGGEAQRVKLARELARVETGRTVYLLDEPSTGLHFADVERLMEVLGRLVDAGNTVVMVEHHMDIVRMADHVVDLGPEGGEGGGYVVAAGTPEEVARSSGHTGRFLSRGDGA
ncbi:MAG: excinuclease ABC subunit UvrA [Myxococcota bacterium]